MIETYIANKALNKEYDPLSRKELMKFQKLILG
jgi:hypothetical protein